MTASRQKIFNRLCSASHKDPICMITSYDAITAIAAEKAGADILLVGDSLATVQLGYASTRELPFEEFRYHLKSVMRADPGVPVVADLPFSSLVDEATSVKHAHLLIEEGASAVKVEASEKAAGVCVKLSECGIPLVGHIGLTPQTVPQDMPFKAVGSSADQISGMIRDIDLFKGHQSKLIIAECIYRNVMPILRHHTDIKIIGIGSGPDADGQVLVFHDIIGWNNNLKTKFIRKYARTQQQIHLAISEFAEDVRCGRYPSPDESYFLKEENLKKILEENPELAA